MAMPNLLSLQFLVPFTAAKIDFSRAIRGLRGMPRRLLLIGHKLDAGNAKLDTIQAVSTEADAVALYGEGSVLVQMWRAAKNNADLGLPIDCIAIATGESAQAAKSTIVVNNSGANLSQAGEVMLYIGGVRVAVGVSTTDTATTVAARLTAAINANAKLPVTATHAPSTANIVVTAKTAGLIGNGIDIRTLHYDDDALPASLSLTIPAMSGGAVSPNITPVIAAMGMYRATEIVCPFTDSTTLALLEAEMAARWQANNMQDGAICTALRGTESAISTWLNTRNSPHVHTIATNNDCTNPWETAAMAGAVIESMAATDPAVPHTDVTLSGYMGPRVGEHWTIDQLNNLLVAGASPLRINQDGSGNLLRMVTNYTQTANGAADRSMAELCWIKTMSYYRWFVVTEYQTKYSGYKLAKYIDEPIPGQKIMTEELAQEIMIGIYKLFCDAALCQHPDYYKGSLVVEIDAPHGKLKVQDEPVIVTQHYQTEVTRYVVAGQV